MDNPDYPPPYPSRGGDKEKKIEVVAKDYGRKPYLGKSYAEMMGRVPTRAILDQVLQKKSQFEKPYLADEEYEEMQHWVPRFPPFPWGSWEDPGSVSFPNLRLPPFDPGDTPQGWPGWPDDEPRPLGTTCPPFMECNPRNETEVEQGKSVDIFVGGMCGNKIRWELLPHGGTGFSLGASGNNFSCIHCQPSAFVTLNAASDAEGWAYVRATDVDYEHEPRSEVICTVKAKCICPDATFAYTSGNPTTIARNADVTITVDNGCSDFSWTVSGTGFSFANSTTTEGSNVLSADNTACGVAGITVTDGCGTSVTGYVRCTTGQWVEKSTGICVVSGPYTETINSNQHERIDGYQKQFQYWAVVCSSAGAGQQCELVVAGCGAPDMTCDTHSNCLPVGCTICLSGDDVPSPMGCVNTSGSSYIVRCIRALAYYEWECV